MIIPVFTSFEIVFPTPFPMNYSFNITVPSLVLLLCKLFTFAHNMRYCFTFLPHILQSGGWAVLSILCFTEFVRIACSCAAHSIGSISTFKSAFLSQYHVSFSSVISGISLANCPYIFLFFHSFFFSLIQFYLRSLFTVSFSSIVSADFTPSINGSTEFLTYHSKLFSSLIIHPSQLINPLHSIFLLRYTLSISLLGCSAPWIFMNFLVFLSCSLIQPDLINFPFFMKSTPHFFIPNCIPISSLNICAVLYQGVYLVLTFGKGTIHK